MDRTQSTIARVRQHHAIAQSSIQTDKRQARNRNRNRSRNGMRRRDARNPFPLRHFVDRVVRAAVIARRRRIGSTSKSERAT
jgi:hypothetical protein